MADLPAPSWERYADLSRAIADEWDQAEQDIKLAEQSSGKVVFPSIKELHERLFTRIVLIVEAIVAVGVIEHSYGWIRGVFRSWLLAHP